MSTCHSVKTGTDNFTVHRPSPTSKLRASAGRSFNWSAINELNLSYHHRDTYQIIGFLNHGESL